MKKVLYSVALSLIISTAHGADVVWADGSQIVNDNGGKIGIQPSGTDLASVLVPMINFSLPFGGADSWIAGGRAVDAADRSGEWGSTFGLDDLFIHSDESMHLTGNSEIYLEGNCHFSGGMYGNGSTLTNMQGFHFSSTNLFVSTLTPTNNGGVYTFTHGLGITPCWVRVVFQCVSADGNTQFAVGDEVDSCSVIDSMTAYPSMLPSVLVSSDATTVRISTLFASGHDSDLGFPVKGSAPTFVNCDNYSKWRLKVYAKSPLQ